MGLDNVKCPHCGYMYKIDLAKYKHDRETVIAHGLFRKDDPIMVSSKYIDLKCPNSACRKWFEWREE